MGAGLKAVLLGLLWAGIPYLTVLLAIAILGKQGYAFLKQRIFGVLRHLGPPKTVGRTRYGVGLILFVLPLVFGVAEPYLVRFLVGQYENWFVFAVAGDVVLLISLFVLGGDFWDKIRALFFHEARVQFAVQPER